jgi:hypothetical protein
VKKGQHPTKKQRNDRKKLKEHYQQVREDAQLQGLIPTERKGRSLRSRRATIAGTHYAGDSE